MTSINDVRLVGKLVKAPEILETSGKKRFAKLSVETWRFVRVNGERRRIAYVHTVICYNQFSLAFIEAYAREGTRVKVFGELGYDHYNKPQVVVPQYNGEVGAMDDDGDEAKPAPQAAQAAAPKTAARPSGGLGRIGQPKRNEDPRPDDSPRSTFVSDAELDDQIPF